MADFEKALEVVLGHEGGGAYTDHPLDRGGPTRWGITQATLASWRGRAVTPDEVRELPEETAREIYRVSYWTPIRGDEIDDQSAATKCLDVVVNMGVRRGSHAIQLAVMWASGKTLVLDNVIGPKTILALNSCEPIHLLLELREAMRSVYRGIVTLRPEQKVFLKGWFARADWGVPEGAREGIA